MNIRLLETASDLEAVEGLQRAIWAGDEVEIVPLHLLVTAAHNGGIVLGAFEGEDMVGFAFGFPGISRTGGEPYLKHCSHMVGVLPGFRDRGIGFTLKRAQWQLVRYQKVPLITWTYDPLQSRNAFFNVAKLGAVCSTYLEDLYGEMRDALNSGLPSDRFQVDLWVNSSRVRKRLDRRPRPRLSLSNYLPAGVALVNPAHASRGLLAPEDTRASLRRIHDLEESPPLLLVEIPADLQSVKAASAQL
ncbi:MAG TPA: hypothetical protein VJ768_02700, partial [Anaerolineales bacterium]|nr:hypothetical protein [Anaerolineales bacterium]